ncbi:3-isopropylmalate dehydrogenase [Subtercola sp. Z020]|uniref:3-isopropylmalate dehydrogenase n=1 Tax=Subtercola sp. Z020 TaxID=2080582 RepID=UPI000CE77EE3|nr:3-isopropylmalate dehydrogenase [Subtercola sp. Z020]PPF87891.1 3-isopropylmalate dehydrogenase [Subtercola sp. Z020]
MSRVIRLAVIPGDGIGPEVVAEALKVLDAVASGSDVSIEKTTFELGAARFLETGDVLTDDDLASIASHDAILLGAVGGVPGDPRLKDANIERGLLLKLRFALDHYVNLRPTTIFPGVTSPLSNPGEVDFVVVREGTEGPYVGNGGAIRVGTPHEIANEVSVNTAFGVERVVRFAFDLANSRPRRKLTLVHKNNVLVFSGNLWMRTVNAVAAEYPAVAVDYLHVDAATIFFVTDPARFDTIVTDNLFGDILTDLAGAISGGIGLASSGNINPTGAFPSMFEPVHGSAPDIAGQQIADPTAAILSVALLLDQQGLPEAATKIRTAVTSDLAGRTAASGSRTTAEVGDAIVTLLTSPGAADSPASAGASVSPASGVEPVSQESAS